MDKCVALIDGDGLLHRCASAVEREVYLVTKGRDARQFDTHKDAQAWIEQAGGDLWHRKELGSETQAVDLLNSLLSRIASEVSCPLKIYIGGLGPTFRHSIARLWKYKDGRKPKPSLMGPLRDLILEQHGASQAHFEEVDDVISYKSKESRDSGSTTIVVSNDKDLDQIPGSHYDWTKGVWHDVSEEDAQRWTWVQTLSGDSTDGIPGCWKVGSAKAEAAISQILSESREVTHVWDCIVAAYAHSQTLAGCPYKGLDPADVAQETYNLIKLKEHEDEWPEPIWTTPRPWGATSASTAGCTGKVLLISNDTANAPLE